MIQQDGWLSPSWCLIFFFETKKVRPILDPSLTSGPIEFKTGICFCKVSSPRRHLNRILFGQWIWRLRYWKEWIRQRSTNLENIWIEPSKRLPRTPSLSGLGRIWEWRQIQCHHSDAADDFDDAYEMIVYPEPGRETVEYLDLSESKIHFVPKQIFELTMLQSLHYRKFDRRYKTEITYWIGSITRKHRPSDTTGKFYIAPLFSRIFRTDSKGRVPHTLAILECFTSIAWAIWNWKLCAHSNDHSRPQLDSHHTTQLPLSVFAWFFKLLVLDLDGCPNIPFRSSDQRKYDFFRMLRTNKRFQATTLRIGLVEDMGMVTGSKRTNLCCVGEWKYSFKRWTAIVDFLLQTYQILPLSFAGSPRDKISKS